MEIFYHRKCQENNEMNPVYFEPLERNVCVFFSYVICCKIRDLRTSVRHTYLLQSDLLAIEGGEEVPL